MTRVDNTIEIAAPLDRVAAFFVPQRMPYWYGSEVETEFEVLGGASDFCAGQKIRITGKMLRKPVRLTVVVTRYAMREILEWQFRDEYGIRGTQRWLLESASPAATRVTMADEYELPSRGRFARLADRFWMRPGVARRARAYLAKLKKLAERA